MDNEVTTRVYDEYLCVVLGNGDLSDQNCSASDIATTGICLPPKSSISPFIYF